MKLLARTSVAIVCLFAAGCSSESRSLQTRKSARPDASLDSGRSDASSSDSGVSRIFPVALNPQAIGSKDTSKLLFAAFSQVGTSSSDSQVLDLAPDIVPRTWSQWDIYGTRPSDYNFTYTKNCQSKGIAFIGGLTASVIFQDEMNADDFADEVGRDAENNPVLHSEVVPGAYRGTLASPGFRQRLIDIAKIQIDGGVDGLFFDEVNSSYIGANYNGDEGFDDHQVADFGRFLCSNYASNPDKLASLDLAPHDLLNCNDADPGATFDYRGYLSRHNAQTAPLGPLNPLAPEWGTTIQNRPDPANGTFVETAAPLVYWQDIVMQVRNYARQAYNKEIFITANGIFPFVDFQTVGLYDWNKDSTALRGFDYVPVVGGHYDGTVSFLTVLSNLKTTSKRLVESAGGHEVPLLLFLDWPTDSINRYYAMPTSERQDYIRIFTAEAYSLGMMLALPLSTTTDTSTATALGMLDSFTRLRAFYSAHAALYQGARPLAGNPTVSASNVTTQLNSLPNSQTALHLINHNYSSGVIAQAQVAVSIPLTQAPKSITVASPDYPADVDVPFDFSGGQVTFIIGSLGASAVVWIR